MRSTVYSAALITLAATSCQNPSSNPQPEVNKNPNIIFIMADDLGYSELGCYGSNKLKTPNLDKLCKSGMKFVDFHSNGAVCSPTRAALMTGGYQQRTGINGVVTARFHRTGGLPTNIQSMPQMLKSVGYKTAMFGKWHLGYDLAHNPMNYGFDKFIGYVSGNIDFHSHLDQEGFRDWWQGKELLDEKGYCTDLITDHAIDYIEKNKSDKFFLYLPYEPPHYPYQGRSDGAQRKLINGKDGHMGYLRPKPSYNKVNSYIEMVEVMDEGIGKIMAKLEALNLIDNTLIVFCSDNGPAKFNSVVDGVSATGGLRGSKNSYYEGGHRVPAFVSWNGVIKPNQVNSDTILGMDFFPTFADITGAKVTSVIDGVSLKELFLTNKPLDKRLTFWAVGGGVAVRDGSMKLVIKGNGAKELYDLATDIKERKNLIKDPNYIAIADRLAKVAKEWLEDVSKGAQVLPKNDRRKQR